MAISGSTDSSPLAGGNVTGISRPVHDVVAASSIEEVRALVSEARRDGVGLYPVSTGLNWGYGSRSPVREGARLLDLGGMNRILNADRVSAENPVAVIEPGVTQGQLHDFLTEHCPELTFNVTGAGRATSILGCALDRGVGYFGPRREDLFGLEMVTGTGEVLRTGFRRLGESSPIAHAHPYGLGPILDGLFFQGNYAIVTSACFRLRRRQPTEVALSFGLRSERALPAFLNALRDLKRDGLITSVTHVGNQARNRSTLALGVAEYLREHRALTEAGARDEAERILGRLVSAPWSSLASISGRPAEVRAALSEIRRRTKGLARLRVVDERKLAAVYAVSHALRRLPFFRGQAAAVHAIKPLHGLALGRPTDIPIRNLLELFDHPGERTVELDQSRCGLVFVNPALPLDGELAAAVGQEMTQVAARHGFTLYMTLNIETEMSMVAVANILFDRDKPDEIERAHVCAAELLAYLERQGLSVYRARADMMDSVVTAEDAFWRTVAELKQVFDPDNVIAPGRYNLR